MNATFFAFGRHARCRTLQACLVLWGTAALSLPAQTLSTLYSFGYEGAGGYNPVAGLVQGIDANFYGTTLNSGTGGAGSVFRITPAGTFTTLYTFCSQVNCADGEAPYAALIQSSTGEFYGTTAYGGASCPETNEGCGTIFKISPSGVLTTIYTFCVQDGCADGAVPYGALALAANGDLYGTTAYGGNNACSGYPGCGTVFKISASGALTTLYSFCGESGCVDGENPVAGLTRSATGEFYGMTHNGGSNSGGTVFRISPGGVFSSLYSFCSGGGVCGYYPEAGLVEGVDGDFYGTTYAGGANDGGTVFRITPTGTLTTLYSFCSESNCTDGGQPWGLVQATNGNLYGTTQIGGTYSLQLGESGTVYEITPAGVLTTLHRFCPQSGCADGKYPEAGLIQATNGDLYGTTTSGGSSDAGTIFSLSVGLGPFVKTQPASGTVGSAVEILGSDLTGATRVTFNGKVAAFKVLSSTLIGATVPAGATTGPVEVVTPDGTLSSYPPFRVLP